jgi:hypothetical protein
MVAKRVLISIACGQVVAESVLDFPLCKAYEVTKRDLKLKLVIPWLPRILKLTRRTLVGGYVCDSSCHTVKKDGSPKGSHLYSISVA